MRSIPKLATIVATTLVLGNCSGSDDDSADLCGLAWTQQVEDEANALAISATAFGQNPSVTTCNAFRAAALSYLDALDDARPCVDNSERAQFDEAVDDAQDSVNELDCSVDFGI